MGRQRARLAVLVLGLGVLALASIVLRERSTGDPGGSAHGEVADEVDAERAARLRGRTSDAPTREATEAVAGSCAVRIQTRTLLEEEVPHAAVRVVLGDGSARRVTTDDEGRARLDGLPPGRVRATATRPGYAISEEEAAVARTDHEAEIHLRLEEAGPLRGRVVDARDGGPVAGATVTALEGGPVNMNPGPTPKLGRVFGTARTDDSGAFLVEGVALEPLCSVRLVRVEAAGYRTLWRIAPEHGQDAGTVVRLVPGGVITGRVLAADGTPVAGATVFADLDDEGTGWDPTLWPDCIGLPTRFFYGFGSGDGAHPESAAQDAWVALRVETDAHGAFRLDGLGLGERYVLGATAPGHAASKPVAGLRIGGGAPAASVELRLQAPSVLLVRCTDVEDRPWPGLEVSVGRSAGYGSSLASGRTDAQGIARLVDLRPGRYDVRIHDERRGWSHDPSVPRVIETTPGDNQLSLRSRARRPAPRAAAPTKVPDDDARPSHPPGRKREPTLVGRVAVPAGVAPPTYVSMVGRRGGGSAWGGKDWEPDASGTLPIAWTVDWQRFEFIIEAGGFLPIVREVDRSQQQVVDLGTLILAPGETLIGEVLALDRVPLGGVQVAVEFRLDGGAVADAESSGTEERSRLFTRRVATDAGGAFRLGGLPRGRVTVRMTDARFLAFLAEVALPATDTPVRFTPPPGTWLRLLAVDGRDHPMPRCPVVVSRITEEEMEYEAWGETDVEGRFRVRLAAGAYEVAVAATETTREANIKRVRIEVVEGEARVMHVVVERP